MQLLPRFILFARRIIIGTTFACSVSIIGGHSFAQNESSLVNSLSESPLELPTSLPAEKRQGSASAELRRSPVKPLSNAHSHNDYMHERPLQDALDLGFTSIEADIFLVNGDLLVGHFLKDVKPERTLEALYLKPLMDRFTQNGGSIYAGSAPVTLLVDIKSSGAETYSVLAKLLERYGKMLSVTKDGNYIQGAVTVIISGNRPIEQIAASNPRFAGIDGRIADLTSDSASSMMPLISDNWRLHFSYLGKGEISEKELKKLKQVVSQAHEKGRRVRFWATPESEDLWQVLMQAEVDLIGTDDLKKLSDYLRDQP